MSNEVFTYNHFVYLHETNSMRGVVYFSNYVKWQGMVREEFLLKTVPEWPLMMQEAIKGNLNMITVEEHSRFIHHSFFGDQITIKIHATELRKLSFKIMFEMTKNDSAEVIYTGWQKLAFDDCKGNFIPIPEALLKSVVRYAPSEEVKKYRDMYSIKSPNLSLETR